MTKSIIEQLEAAREKAIAELNDTFNTLIERQGVSPISQSSDRYNLRVTLKGGETYMVPDAWIEFWASLDYKDQGIEWVKKWVKDYCENSAASAKYRSDTRGLRLRIRNWLKNKIEWAEKTNGPAISNVGDRFERKNG